MTRRALILGWGLGLLSFIPRPSRPLLALLGVALVVVISAHALVQVTHQARSHHVRLQTLQGERDALQVEWSRLLLEESALVNPVRLEQLAGDQFQLRLPEASDLTIKVIQ